MKKFIHSLFMKLAAAQAAELFALMERERRAAERAALREAGLRRARRREAAAAATAALAAAAQAANQAK